MGDGLQLLREIDYVDRKTLTLKEEIQYKGCPFCNIDDGEIVDDYQTQQALFYNFKKCNKCSLVYPYPRPNETVMKSYTVSDKYSNISEKKFNKIENLKDKELFFSVKLVRSLWRKMTPHYSHQEFKKFAKKGYRILDIGAGNGKLAQELIEKGCIVEAVEPNPYRANYIREKLGIKVYEQFFEDIQFSESSYDMIILSQVLMYIFDLGGFIKKSRYIIRSGGIVVSSQLNFNSIIQKTLRAPYPGKGFTAFHMCSWFTADTLKNILEMSGFKVREISYRPMGLFNYIFLGGYPGGELSKSLLRIIDQIITIILVRSGTSSHFTIAAECIKS